MAREGQHTEMLANSLKDKGGRLFHVLQLRDVDTALDAFVEMMLRLPTGLRGAMAAAPMQFFNKFIKPMEINEVREPDRLLLRPQFVASLAHPLNTGRTKRAYLADMKQSENVLPATRRGFAAWLQAPEHLDFPGVDTAGAGVQAANIVRAFDRDLRHAGNPIVNQKGWPKQESLARNSVAMNLLYTIVNTEGLAEAFAEFVMDNDDLGKDNGEALDMFDKYAEGGVLSFDDIASGKEIPNARLRGAAARGDSRPRRLWEDAWRRFVSPTEGLEGGINSTARETLGAMNDAFLAAGVRVTPSTLGQAREDLRASMADLRKRGLN